MIIQNVDQLNKIIKKGQTEHLFMLCEAKQDKAVSRITDDIIKKEKRIILLAGPSSSGKTTTAKKICIFLEAEGIEPIYLGTDDYFIDRAEIPFDENGEQNFEDLDAIDVELFNHHMNDLLSGKEVDIPTYNFISGKKEFGKRKITAGPNQVIVIEGIHALNDALTPLIPAEEKYKIFIAPQSALKADIEIDPNDIRKIRRIVRDHAKRGYSVQQTIKTWKKVVEGEKKNILPYAPSADVNFDSAVIYEPAVLKRLAYPLLLEVKPEEECWDEVQKLRSILDRYEVIIDSRGIEGDSIIREFIGGSTIK